MELERLEAQFAVAGAAPPKTSTSISAAAAICADF